MTKRAAVGLRPAHARDEQFLRALYTELRAAEFAPLGLAPAALEALLSAQYDAQDQGYHARYPAADFDVVMLAGRSIGRLYVDRSGDPIHILDITLLAMQRESGLGTILLQDLIDEATQAGRELTLQVARGNRAAGLYRRLGFTVCAQDEVYLTLARPRRPIS